LPYYKPTIDQDAIANLVAVAVTPRAMGIKFHWVRSVYDNIETFVGYI